METKEMALEEAMTFVINDEPFIGGGGRLESRKWFSNKEAADTYSESLKEQWDDGLGMVYGPFCNQTIDIWWEVSYKETV